MSIITWNRKRMDFLRPWIKMAMSLLIFFDLLFILIQSLLMAFFHSDQEAAGSQLLLMIICFIWQLRIYYKIQNFTLASVKRAEREQYFALVTRVLTFLIHATTVIVINFVQETMAPDVFVLVSTSLLFCVIMSAGLFYFNRDGVALYRAKTEFLNSQKANPALYVLYASPISYTNHGLEI